VGAVGALLHGLQLASVNPAGLNPQPYAPNVVRSIDSYPEGLDLAFASVATLPNPPPCSTLKRDSHV
jgi:hypothetical protein